LSPSETIPLPQAFPGGLQTEYVMCRVARSDWAAAAKRPAILAHMSLKCDPPRCRSRASVTPHARSSWNEDFV